MHDVQAIYFSFAVGVEHDLDRTDQVVNARFVAEMRCRTNDVAAHAAEESHRLGANQRKINFYILALCVRDLAYNLFEEVGEIISGLTSFPSIFKLKQFALNSFKILAFLFNLKETQKLLVPLTNL